MKNFQYLTGTKPYDYNLVKGFIEKAKYSSTEEGFHKKLTQYLSNNARSLQSLSDLYERAKVCISLELPKEYVWIYLDAAKYKASDIKSADLTDDYLLSKIFDDDLIEATNGFDFVNSYRR